MRVISLLLKGGLYIAFVSSFLSAASDRSSRKFYEATLPATLLNRIESNRMEWRARRRAVAVSPNFANYKIGLSLYTVYAYSWMRRDATSKIIGAINN